MRVIFLTHHYPRWPGDFRGAELGALARALTRRGIAVRVVAVSDDGAAAAELEGVPVHRVLARIPESLADHHTFAGRLGSPRAWGTLLRVTGALKRAVRRELSTGTDVIHAHSWLPAGLAVPRSTPLVLTVQGPEAMLLRGSRLARKLARPLLRRAAAVTALTRQGAEIIQSVAGRHLSPDRVQPMPVDTKGHFWTRGGGGAVLAGRLDRAGRVELALEAVASLASCGHDLTLTIIGDGPACGALERMAQQLGIAAMVRFLGPMPRDQARGHLARADVMLVTGRDEGTAGALEALITGVPVVACWDCGGVVELVPESGAGRLSLPSAEALAESVISLQADKARLAAGRLVGEAWRARLAPDHVAQVCEEWYRDALGR